MSRRMIPQKDQDYIEVLSTALTAGIEGNVEVGKNVHIDGNCYADTFGTILPITAVANTPHLTCVLNESSVTAKAAKVGTDFHIHFQVIVTTDSEFVVPAESTWSVIAHIEGASFQSAYQGNLLEALSQSDIDSGAGNLLAYGFGIDSNGKSGNIYIRNVDLTANKTYYLDFNQTINY